MTIASTAAPSNQPGTREWENEGGSLKPGAPASLPEGVIAVSTVHYRVGGYSYSRLEDALAEHDRQSGRALRERAPMIASAK